VALFSQLIFAQVGIGLTDPITAELEVDATDTGIPVLKLEPQTDPSEVAGVRGQLAVIGDKLYQYNTNRSKWLSVSHTSIQYNKRNTLTDTPIRLGGDVRTIDAGAIMPFDGTIVIGTAKIEAGDQDKQFNILVRNGTTTLSTNAVTLVAGELTISLNIDFSAGDYIVIDAVGTDTVSEPTFTLFVRWRP